MDEADILGDRIAIMKSGKINALGTSMFLKSKFGVGYVLKIEKGPERDELPEEINSLMTTRKRRPNIQSISSLSDIKWQTQSQRCLLKSIDTQSRSTQTIITYIQQHLGSAVNLTFETSSEITMQIPHHYKTSFGSFFESLDRDLDKLNVKNYGVSLTTLAEVFT